MLLSVVTSSCSSKDDDEPNDNSSIVGTWIHDDSDENYIDTYTLVFNRDNTGYIRNDYVSRTSEEMHFNWTITSTTSGNLLSVIYKSGDKYMDGPFGDGYAQWNYYVTIAGNTLSILTNTSEGKITLYTRK